MTRAGSIAADAASNALVVAWLVGVLLLAPPDVSLLAGLVLVFGIVASWAITYLAVGVAVDLYVLRRR